MEEQIILSLTDSILDLCNPEKLILYNKKYSVSGILKSFKICVIVPDDIDVSELECTLYLNIDCEKPFDILLYTITEWQELCLDDFSFANKILKNGAVLYEK